MAASFRQRRPHCCRFRCLKHCTAVESIAFVVITYVIVIMNTDVHEIHTRNICRVYILVTWWRQSLAEPTRTDISSWLWSTRRSVTWRWTSTRPVSHHITSTTTCSSGLAIPRATFSIVSRWPASATSPTRAPVKPANSATLTFYAKWTSELIWSLKLLLLTLR